MGVVLSLVLILGAFTAIDDIHRRQATLANLSLLAAQTSTVIANSLQQVMLAGDSQGMQSTLAAVGSDKTLSAVDLLDTSGRVIFAPRAEEIGQRLDNHDSTCQHCHHLPATTRPPNIIVRLPDGRRVFRSLNPIRHRPECHGCHDAHQRLNGVRLTDISMAPLEASLAADLREQVARWVGTILTIVLVVTLGLSRIVIRRLEEVA